MNMNEDILDTQLTVFADGNCPLCMKEMIHLAKCDRQKRIRFIDINDAVSMRAYPNISYENAHSVLHGVVWSGETLLGLDVTHRDWTLVGKGYLTGFIRLPIIRVVADMVYLWFAKNRYKISRVLTRKESCGEGCQIDFQYDYDSVFKRAT